MQVHDGLIMLWERVVVLLQCGYGAKPHSLRVEVHFLFSEKLSASFGGVYLECFAVFKESLESVKTS